MLLNGNSLPFGINDYVHDRFQMRCSAVIPPNLVFYLPKKHIVEAHFQTKLFPMKMTVY